jgi:hypothetical protein
MDEFCQVIATESGLHKCSVNDNTSHMTTIAGDEPNMMHTAERRNTQVLLQEGGEYFYLGAAKAL